jgi:hypothetical protein
MYPKGVKMKNSQSTQDREALLKLLPTLMHKVITAQAQLAAIEDHLEIAQGGILRSSLPPVDGEPQFTPQFVENSGAFLNAIQELDTNLSAVADTIEQIEAASAQVVVGVEVQLQVQVQPREEAELSLVH